MGEKTSLITKIQQPIKKAGPYLDIFSPFLGSLWIAISFLPTAVSMITGHPISAAELWQYLVVSEIGVLIGRQTVGISSWVADTTGYWDRRKQNDDVANFLRGLQLSLLLIGMAMATFQFVQTISQAAVHAWRAIAPMIYHLNHLPGVMLASQITQFAPVVSVVTASLGVIYYHYQAYQAHKDIKYYQSKITKLDKKYPDYDNLYKDILQAKDRSQINNLCQHLPEEAGRYLAEKHYLEQKLQESQRTKRAMLFWGFISIVGLTVAAATVALMFMPLGPMVIATMAVAVKVFAIAALACSTALIAKHYYDNQFNKTIKKTQAGETSRINAALKCIAQNNAEPIDVRSDMTPAPECEETASATIEPAASHSIAKPSRAASVTAPGNLGLFGRQSPSPDHEPEDKLLPQKTNYYPAQ